MVMDTVSDRNIRAEETLQWMWLQLAFIEYLLHVIHFPYIEDAEMNKIGSLFSLVAFTS